eukprot:1154672-Pelagomonas_calceolata.AAC.3
MLGALCRAGLRMPQVRTQHLGQAAHKAGHGLRKVWVHKDTFGASSRNRGLAEGVRAGLLRGVGGCGRWGRRGSGCAARHSFLLLLPLPLLLCSHSLLRAVVNERRLRGHTLLCAVMAVCPMHAVMDERRLEGQKAHRQRYTTGTADAKPSTPASTQAWSKRDGGSAGILHNHKPTSFDKKGVEHCPGAAQKSGS